MSALAASSCCTSSASPRKAGEFLPRVSPGALRACRLHESSQEKSTPPFPIEQPHPVEINGRPVGRMLQRSYLTYAFSVLGIPAISIPCGFTRDGLPVGLQIVGKPRGEAAVLRGAAAFEAAHPWAHRIPPSVEGCRELAREAR